MRSLLFVPGDSEKKLAKGLGSGADCLIVDLEDSVSADDKPAARQMTAEFLAAHEPESRSQKLFVRVNDLLTGLTDQDLAAIVAARPDGIMLPKSSGGTDVLQLAVKLRVYEADAGLEDGVTPILPIVTETALGVINAGTYRDATARLAGMTWGAEDLAADLGAEANRDEEGRYTPAFQHARLMTILAAAACGVPAIDTVYPNFRDEDGFRRDCLEGIRDGFTGRMAIHPSQVGIINEVYTPSADAIAHAQKLFAAFEEAGNPGVVAIDGQMYDRPHLRRAERVIARARAAGLA